MVDERELEWRLLSFENECSTSIATRQWARNLSAEQVINTIRADRGGVGASYRQRFDRYMPPPAPPDVILRSDPQMLWQLAATPQAPFGLWYRGNLDLLQTPLRVAVVGSRRPTGASRAAARHLGSQLGAAGITVVSGLAIGVDGIAHDAALRADGATIAVLGSGVDRIHPSSNRPLARRLMDSGRGLLVSEHSPDRRAEPWFFPRRNRIIAGLSDLVVVVQAQSDSGSLCTAREALDVGIDVAVMSSGFIDPLHGGSLQLTFDGASTVYNAHSVFRQLGMEPPTTADQHEFGTVLDAPRTPDELARLYDQPLHDVLASLLELELAGLVRRTPDGLYVNVAGSTM